MNLNLKKKLGLTFVIGIGCLQISLAQNTKSAGSSEDGANLVKLNLPTLLMKTIHVQYERAIYGKTSVGLGLRVMPKGSLAFKSAFNDIDDQLGSLEFGNIAITPEIKFYLGKGVFKGFYIAPYLKYAHYNTSINYEFTSGSKTEIMPLSGKLNTYVAGVLFGAQWEIANKFYLDWSIFGPQYGISQGSLIGKKSLTTQEQADLKKELDDINLPVGKVTSTVDGNGATVDLKGPWTGIRANIGIGYRF